MKKNSFKVYSFYRFKKIEKIIDIKKEIVSFLSKQNIRGTILISVEGLNGSISGTKVELDNFIQYLKKKLNIRKLEIKDNNTSFLPFNKMKVKIKNEIVSFGQGRIDTIKYHGTDVNPEDWNDIILDENTKLIDVRNEFEIGIGHFNRSINPKTNSFRQFPFSLKKMKLKKDDKIAVYCTGGIRCEKASAYLKANGYKNVYQLKGGVINYFEYSKNNKKKNLWHGECFVFDQRVTIKKNLNKGKYEQCFGCRRPITKEQISSNKYKKGVHCPLCYDERSIKQKNSSLSRQTQIDIANKKGLDHPFKKINFV
tara:strand:+ start:669 stop:1601 length:933 start_codon:yes stop_codon:yes gene_type:complete